MRIYSLNGEQWLMRQAGQERWRQATVPGSVYADLMRDGTLPDPFYRENELEAFALLENVCISAYLKRKKPCCRAERCCCAARGWIRWPMSA